MSKNFTKIFLTLAIGSVASIGDAKNMREIYDKWPQVFSGIDPAGILAKGDVIKLRPQVKNTTTPDHESAVFVAEWKCKDTCGVVAEFSNLEYQGESLVIKDFTDRTIPEETRGICYKHGKPVDGKRFWIEIADRSTVIAINYAVAWDGNDDNFCVQRLHPTIEQFLEVFDVEFGPKNQRAQIEPIFTGW